jgi:DNA repair protein RadC
MLLSEVPFHRRPREKLRERGGQALTEAELLAIVLRSGYRGKSAVEVAQRLLTKHTLASFLAQPIGTLQAQKGIGPVTAVTLTAVWNIVEICRSQDQLPTISQPAEAWQLCQNIITKKQEYLLAIFLNARNQLIAQQIITIGTLNSSLVHAREVFAPALHHRAACLIIAHNHPSGQLEPSPEDIQATEKLVEAGQILDIPVVDHLIVTSSGWFSFKHHQLL